jgi:nucleoside-diphosphate-sugar epimerase
MTVALTGATGLIGSAVLRELLATGHDVTALVRSETSAATATAAGAAAVVGDLSDTAWVQQQFAAADGAIHLASPGDASSADLDLAVARAAVAAFAGTGKRYVHTGGVWVYGSNTAITEESPFAAPQLTAWRESVESEVLGADVRAVVIEPGIVYDPADGTAGLPGILAAPDDAGDHRLVGDGTQHWGTVGTAELARLYVTAYDGDVEGYVIGVNDDHPTVRELAEAAAGSATVVAETPEESEARLFAPLVEALLLDQVADNAKAKSLGWTPGDTSLVEVLAARS